jgi:sigma-B regulation protein RsbU (phosphoserine phosphatase)
MLPRSFDPPAGLRISAVNLPARRMGGDLYDGFAVGQRYYVMVGDVSGKGPGAALWMASLSGLLRYLGEQELDLLAQTVTIDAHLSKIMPAGTFITLLMAAVENDMLVFSNAGHNPGLLITGEGDVTQLPATGLPIGLFPALPRMVRHLPFRTGDRVVLYTDGVVEAQNRHGDMYGMDRLLALVGRTLNRSAEDAADALVRSVRRYAAGTEQSDDITVMIIDRTDPH